jgi:hypothetical protein
MLASFSALQSLCESAALDSYNQLYENMMPILQNIENLLNHIDNPKAKELLDYNAGLLQIILVKVGSKVDDDMANKILVLLKMVFERMKRVTENGLIILNGLINGLGSRIKIDILGNYIVYSLSEGEDDIARLACGIVIDLSNALEENIKNYLVEFVPHLLNILKSKQRSRQTKLQALIAVGDMAMHAGDAFNHLYLHEVLRILESACKLSLQIVDRDEDLSEYLV